MTHGLPDVQSCQSGMVCVFNINIPVAEDAASAALTMKLPQLQYLVHAQVITQREVLVSVPANMRDGVWSLALTEEIAGRKLW